MGPQASCRRGDTWASQAAGATLLGSGRVGVGVSAPPGSASGGRYIIYRMGQLHHRIATSHTGWGNYITISH